MKAALLVCDHVLPHLAEVHGDYPTMFSRLLPDLELDSWLVCDGHFPSPDDYDQYVITGSKLSVYEEIDWILQLKTFVQELAQSDKRIVGICFGHQMIAEALGGRVEKSDNGYLVGLHSFNLKSSADRDDFNMLMLCQDQVSLLPPQAKVLFSHEKCPIGGYTIRDRVLAIQGHPEFTSDYHKDVILSRKGKIGQTKIDQALSSFEAQPDQAWLRQLIMNFLTQKNESQTKGGN